MNKNILTIVLLSFMIFMTSCSAEKYEIEDDTHTDTISRVNTAANINEASGYIFSDEPEENEQTETPSPTPLYIDTPPADTIPNTDTKANDITLSVRPTEKTSIEKENNYEGSHTIVYDSVPPLETKVIEKEAEQVEEVKKEKPKEKAKEKEKEKKPEKKKQSKIISSFKTFFNAANKPRVSNIKKASAKINGAVIKPGKVFSFNRHIGPTGKADGYNAATIIVKGKEKKGFGGGVCQVSSTLYNACEEAGMEIIERHSHSKKVPYLPEGNDAAISYGGIDFKFKNTKDYPVKIKSKVSKGVIVVSVEKA